MHGSVSVLSGAPRGTPCANISRTLLRFLLFVFPLLLLLMGLFEFAVDMLGLAPARGELVLRGVLRRAPLPGRYVLGGWVLESLGLTALFLLVQGRSGAWWLDGLVTGWIAWIFRGPVLVLTLVTLSRLPREPWWSLSLDWLALYTLCGLLIALVARLAGVGR